ncbi:hypothetical protein LLEC1_05045 [Akanthomyces lecanii]|uniref:C2H2-type domain-containing protein n=1 Tax=Cordyceps confragosa TaxID=2714763 RepID=A0A179IK56_CORDF|nr:hypothetical protein LLEC1_05045 [Akanthomyces lecanii]
MNHQSYQRIYFPDDGSMPSGEGEPGATAIDDFLAEFLQGTGGDEGSFEPFSGTFPPWGSSTGPVQAPISMPQQQVVGNAGSSNGNVPNQIYLQPINPGNTTQPATQAILNWSANVPLNQQPHIPITIMASMAQNGPPLSLNSSTAQVSTSSSPQGVNGVSSDAESSTIPTPPTGLTVPATLTVPAQSSVIMTRQQRRSRERQNRALRRSVAHARAHTIAPSPSTSSATSPRSDKEEYAKAKKVSKARKREEKIKCEICKTELSGDHEHDRHFKLVHQDEGWRWQVIDPCEKGLIPDHSVQFEISECKNCQSGKLYGINYNAAAHIRRVHFKNTPNIDGSKGGSSGGAWPEIRYLEYYYMKLVHVQVLDCSRAHRKTPREGIDFVRTGMEQATPYREPSGKGQSSEAASDFCAAEGRASHCDSFMMSQSGSGLSPSGDEQTDATPYTAEMTIPLPDLALGSAFHPQGNAFHPNNCPCGSYDLL